MSGLMGKVRAGEFADVDDLVFIHTGGTASLPVYGTAIVG
jgi:1-aminocyclopropane-1-carboxylate deaminase/D-cysteine desulfhydrase-like pyridoxal-dependent ACC family enzyme